MKQSKKQMSIDEDDRNSQTHLNIPNKKALTKLKGSIKSKNRRKRIDPEPPVSASSRHGSSHKKVNGLIHRSLTLNLIK